MDVDKIQKVNNMALELLKQGLAQSREEAVEQAEKIFSGQDLGGFERVLGQESAGSEAVKEEAAEVSEPAQEAESVVLDAAKIEEILSQNSAFLVKKIQEFQSKMTDLQNEVTFLRNSMNNRSLVNTSVAEAAAVVAAEPEPVQQEEPKAAETSAEPQQTALAEEKKQSHPRSGNYNEDDVSIEKFFYMGSK